MKMRLWLALAPAILATAGACIGGAGAAEFTDDFSSVSPAWQFVSEGVDVYCGIRNGKLEQDFDTPLVGTYPAAGVAGALYANPAFMPETVDMRAVLEFEGDTGHVYAGLLARGDAELGYNAGTGEITGHAYNLVLSGWADDGDIQLNRIGGGVQERLGIVSFTDLGDLIDNNPIYMKLTVETLTGGEVELKGVVSTNSNFSDPFGEIEYIDATAPITGPGMIGIFGTNDQTYICNPVNVKFDDLYVADFIDTRLPGDCNGDGFVNSLDLDIVRGNWGQTVGGGAGDGDLSGDGVVNSGDLDLVRGNWGAVGAAAVPEPGSVVFLSLAGLLLVWKRR